MTDFTKHLIAFTGKLGSGKDTAAERFESLISLPTRRLSFARKLKESAAALFDIDPTEWEWMKNDGNVRVELLYEGDDGVTSDDKLYATLTAREFLQRYGTESHRGIFGDAFWVNQALIAYDKFIGSESVWLVTDCRFENEAAAIKDRGGVIVCIHGPNSQTGTHTSEAGLPDDLIDYYVRNTEREDNFFKLDSGLLSLATVLKIQVPTWA